MRGCRDFPRENLGAWSWLGRGCSLQFVITRSVTAAANLSSARRSSILDDLLDIIEPTRSGLAQRRFIRDSVCHLLRDAVAVLRDLNIGDIFVLVLRQRSSFLHATALKILREICAG